MIGVGGAGGNAVDRLQLDGFRGADLAVVNTDLAALNTSPLGETVLIGRSVTRGLSAGGDAELELRFVRESGLLGVAGFLALLGFLAGLLLPKTAKLSTISLLAVGLGVLTAVPVVLAGAWYTPLLNALALGLIVAAPVTALAALGAVWKTTPFARLSAAIKATRDARATLPRRQESDVSSYASPTS